jgi:quercetin dioxygenase-like cupin family protein
MISGWQYDKFSSGMIIMWKRRFTEFDEQDVSMANSTGTSIRWLVTQENAENVNTAMRRFEIAPGGQIGLHSHPEYHEIYILGGKARVFNDQGDEVEAIAGDVLYVPPNEPHAYETLGSEKFEFLCIIPILQKE